MNLRKVLAAGQLTVAAGANFGTAYYIPNGNDPVRVVVTIATMIIGGIALGKLWDRKDGGNDGRDGPQEDDLPDEGPPALAVALPKNSPLPEATKFPQHDLVL